MVAAAAVATQTSTAIAAFHYCSGQQFATFDVGWCWCRGFTSSVVAAVATDDGFTGSRWPTIVCRVALGIVLPHGLTFLLFTAVAMVVPVVVLVLGGCWCSGWDEDAAATGLLLWLWLLLLLSRIATAQTGIQQSTTTSYSSVVGGRRAIVLVVVIVVQLLLQNLLDGATQLRYVFALILAVLCLEHLHDPVFRCGCCC